MIPSIYLLSVASGLAALLAFVLISRVVKPIDLDQHQQFLDAMLSIVGTLVSVLLGLLVASAIDHYRTLEQNVDSEASNIAQVFRLAGGLPQPTRRELRQLCVAYCTEVVNDEWPAMETGHSCPAVTETAGRLSQCVVTFVPRNDGETNIHSALLTAVEQTSDCRRERLLALHNSWKRHLMPVLVMCSLIVLAFAFLYARQGAILHGLVICLVAVALGANLGLIFLLANPFSGEWKIQPVGIRFNLQLLEQMQGQPELQQDKLLH